MKVLFRNIHLYLSLAAGLVIALVCLTGALLVFEKELQHTIYPHRYKVEVGTQRVPVEQLVATVEKQVPEAKVTAVKLYDSPARSIEVTYKIEEKVQGEEEPKSRTELAFMNPYTGELLEQYNHRNSFFYTVFALHRWLLADDTGKLIVGISTSMFLFILITGIILWWPQNKKILKQRLKLKWDGGWKRLNHDLHIVVGFYTAIFLFAFAFTGLAWSFTWFNDGIYWITGTENVKFEPPVSTPQPEAQAITLDQALATAEQMYPGASYYNLNRPEGPEAAVAFTVMPKEAIHDRASDQIFLDQYSGAVIGTNKFAEKNLGQRIRGTFYPVHVGSIGGLPTRIIALIACIAGFTFPITGVILWINRINKPRKKKKSKKLKDSAVDEVEA
ncbi:PepSY-associated TM helix domain-containing protein [Telluribacter humicola]|uniref:PepSY-associated TM helix domain-containing protein n=1 Tax=Telluribacter humicola TaxID=1720261 RepID=UPI001A95F46D|nr:PepSY-associated TM helix domain-containing protein [Telluribacter humicola]